MYGRFEDSSVNFGGPMILAQTPYDSFESTLVIHRSQLVGGFNPLENSKSLGIIRKNRVEVEEPPISLGENNLGGP